MHFILGKPKLGRLFVRLESKSTGAVEADVNTRQGAHGKISCVGKRDKASASALVNKDTVLHSSNKLI